MTATTFRTDTANGIMTALSGVITANPTLLKRAYRARPVNVTPDMPVAFIDSRPETVHHDSGTRTRTMRPSVVLIWEWSENLEAMAAIDTLIDIMVDAFTAMPQFSTGAIWSDFTVADEEYTVGDYLYPSVRFSFPNVSAMDGRI